MAVEFTSRRKIFELLKKSKSATAGELASMLDCTTSNIRHHLDQLLEDKLIKVIKVQRKMNRGRPAQVYAPSSLIAEDSLETLTGILLEMVIKENIGNDSLIEIVHKIIGRDQEIGSLNSNQMISLAINRMNKLHYQAHWEAGRRGPSIILGNCPYKSIIEEHPELCQMDALMLREMIKIGFFQKAKLEEDEKGFRFCSFVAA